MPHATGPPQGAGLGVGGVSDVYQFMGHIPSRLVRFVVPKVVSLEWAAVELDTELPDGEYMIVKPDPPNSVLARIRSQDGEWFAKSIMAPPRQKLALVPGDEWIVVQHA